MGMTWRRGPSSQSNGNSFGFRNETKSKNVDNETDPVFGPALTWKSNSMRMRIRKGRGRTRCVERGFGAEAVRREKMLEKMTERGMSHIGDYIN